MATKARLAGEEYANPKDLAANPRNWRVHSTEQERALATVLDEVGWVQRVIVNRTTGFIFDGHLRVKQALKNGDKTVPVQYVELSESEEGIILATFDPLGAMAGTNDMALRALLDSIETDSESLTRLLLEIESAYGVADTPDIGVNYSRKIVPPIYEPKGDKPSEKELVDRSKTNELLARIGAVEGLPQPVENFLKMAAERHTVFLFDQIAEYYSHATPEIQDLMEESALVIIDFERAIEDGFVRISQEMMESASEVAEAVTTDEDSDEDE